jgi:hypothetical protein
MQGKKGGLCKFMQENNSKFFNDIFNKTRIPKKGRAVILFN